VVAAVAAPGAEVEVEAGAATAEDVAAADDTKNLDR